MSIRINIAVILVWRLAILGQNPIAGLEHCDQNLIEGATVWLPATLISRQIDQQFSEEEFVECEILGTKITGVSRCNGRLVTNMDAAQGRAEIRCVLKGVIESENTGTNGPAKIDSTTSTSFTAIKIVKFDGVQLTTSPVKLEIKTSLTMTNVGTHLEGMKAVLVKRIATARLEATKEEVRGVAEELTKKRLSEKIECEFEQQLSKVNLALKVCRQSLVKIGNRELQISTRQINEETLEFGIKLVTSVQQNR